MGNSSGMAGEKIRVLIVDDHAMVRRGLRTFLELQDTAALPIEVAGEAANGIEAVELAKKTQPDIVLLDLVMPEMDGIRSGEMGAYLCQFLRHHHDTIRIRGAAVQRDPLPVRDEGCTQICRLNQPSRTGERKHPLSSKIVFGKKAGHASGATCSFTSTQLPC